MADFRHSTPALSANPIAFDPAQWLSHFASVGGWWVVSAGGVTTFGWMREGYSETQNDQALALWREVGCEDRRALLSAHALASAGGVRHD